MRRFFIASLVAFVALFPLQAAEAKTLRMAYDSDPTSLDPHEQLSGATLQLSHLLFDPLIRFQQDLTHRAAPCQELGEDRRAHHALSSARGGEVPVGPHALRRRRGVDVQSAEAESRLQGAVRAVQRGASAVDDLTVDLVTKGPYPLVLNLATYIFPMDREFYSGTDERGKPKDAIVKSWRVVRFEPCRAARDRSSSPSASRG